MSLMQLGTNCFVSAVLLNVPGIPWLQGPDFGQVVKDPWVMSLKTSFQHKLCNLGHEFKEIPSPALWDPETR